MAAISSALVKELRQLTGLGILECKKALAESQGDIDKAVETLRKHSGLKAAKKAGRIAAEGIVLLHVAQNRRSGALLEVNCETDFVARDSGFRDFAQQVLSKLVATGVTEIESLLAGELEDERQALVQKIGENINVRRAIRVEAEVVDGYLHSNHRIATLVTLKGGNFELARDIAMHVTAVSPRVVRPEEMPSEIIEKEQEIIRAQPDLAGKPPEIVEKMIAGRMSKFLKESSLTEQSFVKDVELTVGKLAAHHGAQILSFVRYEVGEGIEVEKKDFAAEVAEQLKG